MIIGNEMPTAERQTLEINDGEFILKTIPRSDTGGGRLNINKVNEKWHIQLHTPKGEIYDFIPLQFDDTKINDAVCIKKALEKEAGDGGADKLLIMGGDQMWEKQE
ncbi:hypothetical protein [Methanoregula sp.]|uniref:hypothetical protein n=1 Tax=Methanoregula sp. TaxID=2052170 RepID=UPI0035650EA5